MLLLQSRGLERLEGKEHLRGTSHDNFASSVSLPPGVVCGALDNRRAAQIANAYLLSFFNKHLKGLDDHLLDGPSSAFPEVNPFLRK